MDSSAKQYKILDPDNCAMCGMCLNHCPTYKVNNNESESPRGRISIIHGLNASLLAPTESALKHLNSCTLCLACESACPAKVDFYDLITKARDKYYKKQKFLFKLKSFFISSILTNPILKRILFEFTNFAQDIFLYKKFFNIKQKKYHIDAYDETAKDGELKIGIFSGCASDIFQKNVASDCIEVLKKNNIKSELVQKVECCGSLDYNCGKIEKGLKYNDIANNKFSNGKYKKVIGYASGCSSFINKNNKSNIYEDATSFILNLLSNKIDKFKETNKNVCIHRPCTTRSAEIDFQKLLSVLDTIPNLKIFTFEDNYCCGAGAQNLLHNTKNSINIIEPKIEFVKSNKIDLILTYNIGCSLNFINSININNMKRVDVMHPISFINERLK